MNKWKGNRLICGGLLLIAAALFLGAVQIEEARCAADSSERVRSRMEAILSAGKAGDGPSLPETEEGMPSMEIDGDHYIGILSIPDLDLSLPVMSDWSDSGLKLSPCRYTGSVYTDDLIVAAHNYPQHFGSLKELETGSLVTFLDTDGNEFQYEVIRQEELGETDLEKMKEGEWDLTLFTCSVSGADRVTVRCGRISPVDNPSNL